MIDDADLRVIAHLTGLSPADAQELTNTRPRPPATFGAAVPR